MSGQQQTVAASGTTSSNATVHSSTAHTGVDAGNESAAGASVTTPSSHDKPIASSDRSNNSPPVSMIPTGAGVNGPVESDPMNSVDDQTATGGDAMNKDRS